MRYRLHNPLELRDPLGVFYQMCMVFSQSREEFPSTLICSLTFTIPLTLKSASLQHFVGTGVFSDSDSCIGFQFNPLTHKTLISTPECCFLQNLNMKILSFADYKHLLKKLLFQFRFIFVPQVLFIYPLYT